MKNRNWLDELITNDTRDPRVEEIYLTQKKLRNRTEASSAMDARTLWEDGLIADPSISQSSNLRSKAMLDTVSASNVDLEQRNSSGTRAIFASRTAGKPKSKEKESKKNALKKKKKKKLFERVQDVLSASLSDSDVKTGTVMAEVMKYGTNVLLADEQIWLYNEEVGCYRPANHIEVGRVLRSLLPEDEQLKISSREYKEAFEQLKLADEIHYKARFFENKPYVNCLNGVVDVLSGKILDHDPAYYFKHCIQANYLPGGGRCPRFKEYLETITSGDKELKRLIRAMIGYICSHYNNAKTGFLVYGIPHTGKSVLLNTTERILGSDLVSHADLSMLHKQEYVATLSGKLLNVAPDLRNEPLRDVGLFKSLVSHDDQVSARALYGNPIVIRGEVKMLFASNHLLQFDGTLGQADVEAVLNRLIYIPFMNPPIRKSEEDKHLSEALFEERDGIFTWAMEGLKDYVQAREQFPECRLSTELKESNMAAYCPEKVFFMQRMKRDPEAYESTTAIREAFKDFCEEVGIHSVPNIGAFLEEHEGLIKIKKRIKTEDHPGGTVNPIYVYTGVRLKKKYRTTADNQNEED